MCTVDLMRCATQCKNTTNKGYYVRSAQYPSPSGNWDPLTQKRYTGLTGRCRIGELLLKLGVVDVPGTEIVPVSERFKLLTGGDLRA